MATVGSDNEDINPNTGLYYEAETALDRLLADLRGLEDDEDYIKAYLEGGEGFAKAMLQEYVYKKYTTWGSNRYLYTYINKMPEDKVIEVIEVALAANNEFIDNYVKATKKPHKG